MSASDTYRIRPAGRHLLTIGRDLIQDSYAAVIELVKNAYDADSPDVEIEFSTSPDRDQFNVIIADHGHGMSRETVINKWMVPSTQDKLDREKSPAGRVMQGRKGIGRYAASILGSDLRLETVTAEGEKTTAYIRWEDFEDAQYLDDVEVLIESEQVTGSPGTRLSISGNRSFLNEWDSRQFEKLQFELKKLKSPLSTILEEGHCIDDFVITLKIRGFESIGDTTETIEPYPILEFFDYRIAGTVSEDGKGTLKYTLQKVKNAIEEEEIPFDLNGPTRCGELALDIRVYDRETESIESLIGRGLKDEKGKYLGKLQVKKLLNENNGIGVYRHGFRVRPLGDTEFDWLKLNEQRVQNPSMRIGSNQAIGYVQIQSDDQSGLMEKSARDGLKENDAYERLKVITKDVIGELEKRRYSYRRKVGLSRTGLKTERNLELLFSYEKLKRDIRKQLSKCGIDESTTTGIIELINQEEQEKNKVVDELREIIAIYQGQATLGKIINVILHEGRRPLNYFKNQIPNLRYSHDVFLKTRDPEESEEILDISNGIGENAQVFVTLFGRLDPLATGKRLPRKPLQLKSLVSGALSVFEGEMKTHGISGEITGSDDFTFSCWPQDIYAVFTNLIDNSIYWICEKGSKAHKITIEIVTNGNQLAHIDYRDNGPGIEKELITSEVIFEPHFTTKPGGVGLGLAIAGEAAERNGLELLAIDSERGAWFRLQPKSGNAND